MTLDREEAVPTRASQPSLVESFAIHGLYGYRTVSLTSSFAATILIARNGSGKTTLLGALDAFLRRQFTRLRGIQFEKVSCKLRNVDRTLELSKAEIELLASVPDDPEFISWARRFEIDPRALLEFLESDYSERLPYRELHELEIFQKIYAKANYDAGEARKFCEKLSASLKGRVPAVDQVRAAIEAAIGDTQIVYLPTYRRIELSLGERDPSRERTHVGRRAQSIQSRLGLKRGFFNTDIQFGLGDISERLEALNQELLFNSNQGYSEISAKIINDLLDGTFEREAVFGQSLPKKDALRLFFSRIEQGNRRFLQPFGNARVPDINKIYSEGATTESSNQFLRFFLGQLNTVIEATGRIESLVESFVEHCNAYLAEPDLSAEVAVLQQNSPSVGFQDGKRLELDRKNLRVTVFSLAARRKVPLDSLSSGEKQMISLFARLYLYPGNKIVLIDEPELSLSIDWQRKILLDVVEAPTCSQIIAITHSPFVFDNTLEPYAKALSVAIDPTATENEQPIVEDDDG